MARIYISSTYEDLVDYRKAVTDTLRKFQHQVICMEDYVATDQRPLDKCLNDIDTCDLYVGIFAWRYGYIPPQNNPERKSITELEYRRASRPENRKPCLIFLLAKGKEVPWPLEYVDDPKDRINALRNDLSENETVSFFKEPNQLAALVGAAVTNALVAAHQQPTNNPHTPAVAGRAPVEPPRVGPLPEPLPLTPLNWREKLVRRFLQLSLAAKLGASAGLVLCALLALSGVFLFLPAATQEQLKIKLRVWPVPIRESQEDYFGLTSNGEPNMRYWDYPKGSWKIVRSAGSGDPTQGVQSGVLEVGSPSWGVRADAARQGAFYDFQLKFKVRLAEGNRAGWVLRAQKDKQSGYVFELEKRGAEVFLNGWASTAGQMVPLGNTPDNKVPLPGPFLAEDFFEITALVTDCRFDYTVAIQSETVLLDGHLRSNLSKPFSAPELKDDARYFRFGNVGFFAPEKGKIWVDDYELSVSPK